MASPKIEGRFLCHLLSVEDLLWLNDTALRRAGLMLNLDKVKLACVYGPQEDAPRTVVLYDNADADVDTVPLCVIFLED